MSARTQKLTKRQRRQLRREGLLEESKRPKVPFQLKKINPKTSAQEEVWKIFEEGKNIFMHGSAGTGKTFISLYLALRELNAEESFNKITIVRSAVPTRDVGFLPGNLKEKARIFEQPYEAICTELYGRGDAYSILQSKGEIDFVTTSYIRGINLRDTIIIVDEAQNMTFHELDSVITRCGNNCRIIFCGDYKQNDLADQGEQSGVIRFSNIIKQMKAFKFVEFYNEDIVRSKMVKEYLIAKNKI